MKKNVPYRTNEQIWRTVECALEHMEQGTDVTIACRVQDDHGGDCRKTFLKEYKGEREIFR
jgi:hypothetical protein